MAEVTPRGLEKVPVNDLVAGMFVARLDRPWAGTPFPVQGFHLRDHDDIQKLRVHCDFVYVDYKRSRISRKDNADTNAVIPVKVMHGVYDADHVSFAREVGRARPVHRALSTCMADAMEQLRRGEDFPYLALHRLAARMVDSICRNPDAGAWVSTVYDQDAFTCRHAVRASIRAVTVGRHIGLERDQLLALMLGCLLADIGRSRLTDELRDNADGPPHDEREAVKRHVQLGVEILTDAVGVDPAVIGIVAAHHERHDGSGYPHGLEKNAIPLLARISGLADYYETLTRAGANGDEPLSPADAMAMLHELRGIEFQGQLVGELIQALGVYPTGSLIRLDSGDIAIVREQNADRRLKPTVMLLLKKTGKRYWRRRIVDLYERGDEPGDTASGIARSLPHGAFGIDPRSLAGKRIFGF